MNDSKLREVIRQRLIKERKKQRYSQQQIADGIKIKRSVYQSYEDGRARPSIETIYAIVKLYGYHGIDHFIENKSKRVSDIHVKYYSATPFQRSIVDFILK